MDFKKTTFIERVSLATREPVYSAAFAWLLSEHSPLPLEQRLSVVTALSGADTASGRAISATTEWHDLDLLLTIDRATGPLYIAIENKIKATEGKDQLTIYDQHLKTLPGEIKKIFLTLTGVAPRSGFGWVPSSYSVFLNALRAQPSCGDHYVADICSALARLVAVSDAASEDEGALASVAFGDNDVANGSGIASYVDEMRLQKVVQRIWMTALADALHIAFPWTVSIDETRGQALLNIEAALQDHPGYLVGMQLQLRVLKAFCVPYPYPKSASEDQHRSVDTILQSIRSGLALDQASSPSYGRTRGFRSFRLASLPPGRKISQWVEVIEPHVLSLATAFPNVLASALGPWS